MDATMDSDDDFIVYTPEDLKEKGNAAYSAGNTEEAITLWRNGLKEALKRSCRGMLGKNNFEMCLTFRLNMAQGLIKQKMYVEALDQLQIVLEQQENNVKAMYRTAYVHSVLQEWDKCEETCTRGLQIEPDNTAFKKLLSEMRLKKVEYNKEVKAVYSKMYKPEIDDTPVEKEKEPNVLWSGEGSSDDPQSDLWSNIHTGQSLKDDNRPLILSLPLTVVNSIEIMLNKDDSFSDSLIGRRLLTTDTFMVHVVGVRGDVEMDCMWSTILHKLPNLQKLRMIGIGFIDDTDLWGCELDNKKLGPPLTKCIADDSDRRVICRLFKGTYQNWLQKYPRQFESCHPYHPDIILIPEPCFSRHFDSWIPAIHEILQSDIPCVFTGYSAVGFDSHEALNIDVVLDELGARFVSNLKSNPYAIKIQPEESLPPMPCFQGYGVNPYLHKGPSAKNAVFCIVRGFVRTQKNIKLTDDDVKNMKQKLKDLNVDVDIGEVNLKAFKKEAENTK